ncbi:MAG: radical SAM protein [Candidatus Thiodiazotropha endolucinida]
MFFLPSMLSIVTTYQCTASCDACCFKCNPLRKETLSSSQIRNVIEQTADIPSIKTIVFTGGECFLLGKDLVDFVELCSSKYLRSRIVSNGYWATSISSSYNRLAELCEAGLDELNISVGEEHQKYVKIEYLYNAVNSACAIGLRTAINVETRYTGCNSIYANSDLKQFVEYAALNGCYISHGLWNEEENCSQISTIQPCFHMGQALTVSPDYKVKICCGLTVMENDNLCLGSLTNRTLKNLLVDEPEDLLKMAIKVYGPAKILIDTETGSSEMSIGNYSKHPCKGCLEIYDKVSNYKAIEQYIIGREFDIIQKYKTTIIKEFIETNESML